MNLDPIRAVMEKYSKDDAKRFKACADLLCQNGIARSNYHDFAILADLLCIMYLVVDIIEEKNDD